MTRLLELVIIGCDDCPYFRYDAYYSRSTDSGYRCDHPKGPGRIIDESKVKDIKNFPIPIECPLKEIKG